MEVYPSLAEGIGLENRQAGNTARGFESLYLLHFFKIRLPDVAVFFCSKLYVILIQYHFRLGCGIFLLAIMLY